MKSRDVAAIFSEMADLMEIQGEQSFRINSYRRAARTMKDQTTDIDVLAAEGKLGDLPGIGKGLAGKIEEFLATGKIKAHQELLAAVDTAVREFSAGPQRDDIAALALRPARTAG